LYWRGKTLDGADAVKNRPDGLPDFETPPLTEVVLGVQFEPLKLTAPHIGVFWTKVRDRFPVVRQVPALEPVTEIFGVKAVMPQASFRLMNEPETPRCWLIDRSGSQLIQVQPDRLIHNWRKVEGEGVYPRYESIRAAFAEELQSFEEFVTAEQLGGLKPTQCEVTYINHVKKADVWEDFGQAHRVFRVWAPSPQELALLPEDVRFSTRFVIRDDAGKPAGRLHVEVQPGYQRTDEAEVFAFTLTARGLPEGDGIDGVMRFLDRGRLSIVRTFDALTTPEMHRVWRKHGI
jgi:uncharacterized protein (TIGR04255 family)